MRSYFFKLLTPAVLLSSLLFPILANGIEIENPLEYDSVTELLCKIIDVIFNLALGVAPIMIIVAGFYFVTAMGEPAKIQTAKQIILWALIGLLVVFCAKGFIQLFNDIFREGEDVCKIKIDSSPQFSQIDKIIKKVEI